MYQCRGDVIHLDKGIEKLDEIKHLAEEKSEHAQEYWNVLTGLVRFRYELMQVKEDIHRAVDTARKSLERTPLDSPHRTKRIHNLAGVLWLRFDREGGGKDLEEAIQCATDAERNTSDLNHFTETILSTLSGLLIARYMKQVNADDLNKAVLFARKAVHLGRPTKLEYLANRNNLARILQISAMSPIPQVDSSRNITEAVGLFQSVVDQTLPTDGKLPSRLRNLGNTQFEHYKITGSVASLGASVRNLSKCAHNPVASPSLRIEAARKAADILILQANFAEADVLLQLAVSLLQRVSPRSLQQKDQQDAISKFSGMTTVAASVALQAGATAEKALEILEEGRGIILGLLFDVRSDISALRSQHPDLATRFEHLRSSLESPAAQASIEDATSGTNVSLDFTHRNNIVKQLDESIAQIREQDGFLRFLAPPSMEEMQAIASAGPVIVINVSEYRSDAFIVASSRLEHVALSNLQLDAIKTWATLLMSRKITQPKMFELLRWLWDVLVQPILEALQRSGLISHQPSDKPRLWWVPSGPLCSLPIHAAGNYTKNSSSILMDKVISSYSPSIKAMIYSQRNAKNTASHLHFHRPLIVSMGTTPGGSDLPSADEEGKLVRKELSKLSTIDELPEVRLKPNKAAVIADMSRATILHFAGHGLSDPKDPLESTLLVEDWQQDPLTVKDLLSLRLHEKPPFIAYLSACSTGRSSADKLIDEGLHLMRTDSGGNAQASKTVASTGSKRKRDGASDPPMDPVPKKREWKKTADAVPDKQTAAQKAAADEANAKEFRIKFYQEFYPPHPGDVPEEHQIKFKHIQQLGKMSYESYAIQPRPDTIDKPWELENKRRAKQMIYWAVRSRDDYQNEDSWRMELEPYVFKRFKIEVGCTGLTDIFTYRIGERSFIQNDPENCRIEKKPDRVYGLRTTEAMAESLQRLHISHLGENTALRYLSQRLTMSCNPDSGDQPCIYPFLAMEAKSLKGDGDWKYIETQTAIPIRNHLYLQLQLQDDQDNKMKVPGGPLSWFLAHIGEQWRKANLLWEGSITGHDAALQLVLIMDYIVDWARDIYRPNIIRQLKSVVDKGQQSSYTVTADPDILSRTGYANSRIGDGPFAAISRAETAEILAKPAFDAKDSTIVPALKPLFESTGKHVDIRVWESAKYESRVRGLYITGTDDDAQENFTNAGWDRLRTVHASRCWFLLSSAQGIKIIEQAWTGLQDTKDVEDLPEQKILVSLFVRYRMDDDGVPIRELTYIAITESVAQRRVAFRDILEQNELVISAEDLDLKLREAWASSPESYFRRYASDQTNVLCVTASEQEKLDGRVVLSFHNDSEVAPWARRLDEFIKRTCENPRARSKKLQRSKALQ
ncbi:hypothetical protein J4E85_010440 [Alternaria conjuncta]|uniref:uncharacterized protein n=1 Tax=Alternaria conjuncta TaxID=181017 RepID=UPI002220C029|nr:uncharacterized protein J4E85_010440 [Alternaria conjuncta]KAI4915315.1 hypothetical protein J4E85_010440 [Alternaria conjuncta]